MAKTLTLDAPAAAAPMQTELARLLDELAEAEAEAAETGRQYHAIESELRGLQQASRRNPGPDGAHVDALLAAGERIETLTKKLALLRPQHLAKEQELRFCRDRVNAKRAERSRLLEQITVIESELGGRGQAARLEQQAKDLLSRAENFRAGQTHELEKARARLAAIGE